MGKPSRDKGARGERDLVKKLREAGLDAKRVPLSGACKGFKDDVAVEGWLGNPEFVGDDELKLVFEVKAHAAFKNIYDWLGGVRWWAACNQACQEG